MGNSNLLQKLQAEVLQALAPLVNADYVYLELPYYENPGDVLIWEGTEQFLSKLPYRCLYKASARTYQHRELSNETIIILQGGGNFGDLWSGPQEFRKRIIREYPNNRIIILPQTVYYQDYQHAREDAVHFSLHQHLTICARDKKSYEFLQLFRFSKNTLLVPDMAFCIEPDSLKNYLSPTSERVLLVSRGDKESSDQSVRIDEPLDVVQDWPTYVETDPVIRELNRMIEDDSVLRTEVDEFADRVLRPHLVQVAFSFLSPFRKIYTTRLHAAILSVILGKEVAIIDNSYGKNSSFYYTWLEGIPEVMCLSQNGESCLSFNAYKYALLTFADAMKIKVGAIKRKIL